MPKKLNSAGEEQNYVPSGNGDASGEYADQESGSNIHFTNFKKPDGNDGTEKIDTTKTIKTFKKPSDDEQKTDSNDIQTTRKNTKKSLRGKVVNPSRENDITMDEVIDDSTDEGVKILGDYLNDNNSLNVKFGNAGANAAGWASGYRDIVTNHEIHTIRHELGHTFDNFYGKDLPVRQNRQFTSDDYASCRFVDQETGKTMNEMLHEELQVSMYKGVFKGWNLRFEKQGRDKTETKIASAKRILDVYYKYADKVFDEKTGIKNSRLRHKELTILANKVRDEAIKETDESEIGKSLRDINQQIWKAQDDYRNEQFRKGATSIAYSNDPRIRELTAKKQDIMNQYNAYKDNLIREKFGDKNYQEYKTISDLKWKMYKELDGPAGIVGDTLVYLGVGDSSFYGTRGHGSTYFNDRKEGGYALEIFANMFDSYMSKESWKKDFVREAFPKSAKIFEQILYKKGR